MKKIAILGLGLMALGMTSQGAFAQRDPASGADKRAQRQQEMANMTPDQRAQYMQQRWQERLNSATPDQRAQMESQMQQMQAQAKAQGLDPNDPNVMMQMMRGNRGGNNGTGGATDPAAKEAQRRQLMTAAGITDKATQDAILAFITGEEKAHEPLLQLARAAAATLTPAAPATGATVVQTAATTPATPDPAVEAKVSSAFDAYTTALAADKTRHDKALETLDASIGYSKTPRLKAFLTLVGVIDNDALALGGAPAIFNTQRPAGGRGGNGMARPSNAGGTVTPPAGAEALAQ